MDTGHPRGLFHIAGTPLIEAGSARRWTTRITQCYQTDKHDADIDRYHLTYLKNLSHLKLQININPLIATLKPQSNGPSYNNIEIGTLTVDGWAVTFGTARRGLGEAAARPGPSLYQM